MAEAAVVDGDVAEAALAHGVAAGHVRELADAAGRVPGVLCVAGEDLNPVHALDLHVKRCVGGGGGAWCIVSGWWRPVRVRILYGYRLPGLSHEWGGAQCYVEGVGRAREGVGKTGRTEHTHPIGPKRGMETRPGVGVVGGRRGGRALCAKDAVCVCCGWKRRRRGTAGERPWRPCLTTVPEVHEPNSACFGRPPSNRVFVGFWRRFAMMQLNADRDLKLVY